MKVEYGGVLNTSLHELISMLEYKAKHSSKLLKKIDLIYNK